MRFRVGCVLLGPLLVFAFCGCQISDIFVAGNAGASDDTEDTRPVPDDTGQETSEGNDGSRPDEVQQFSVQVVITPEGSGTVSMDPPGGTYDEGTEVTLIAMPSDGFVFAGYEGDLIADSAEVVVLVDRDLLLTAKFFPLSVSVSVYVEPPDAGVVTLTPPGGTYEWGTTITLDAQPNPGFSFEAYVDEEGTAVSSEPTYSVTAQDDVVITALFVAVEPELFNLTVNVDPLGAGTVSLDPSGGSYSAGSVVIVTAAPAPGYIFAGYSGDASGTSSSTAITMNTSKSVRALFEWAPQVGNPGNLLVTGFAGSNVTEFDRFDGALLDGIVEEGSGNLTLAGGIDFGPNGDVFVASFGTNNVLRYDGATGAFLGEFAAVPGFFSVLTLRFGPNGNLYVPDTASDSVLEFDGNNGEPVGTFIAARSGGLDNPLGLAFGPNGNLFVVSQRTNSVIEYNGATGALIGRFADLEQAGFTVPVDLAFNAAGDAFITTSGDDSVARVDGMTRIVTTFVGPGVGGLDSPAGITVHPDTGNVLVVNQSSDQVLAYDGSSGEFVGVFATGRAGDNLFFMAFRPR